MRSAWSDSMVSSHPRDRRRTMGTKGMQHVHEYVQTDGSVYIYIYIYKKNIYIRIYIYTYILPQAYRSIYSSHCRSSEKCSAVCSIINGRKGSTRMRQNSFAAMHENVRNMCHEAILSQRAGSDGERR